MPTVYVRKSQLKKPAKKEGPTGTVPHSSGKYKATGNKVMIKTKDGHWKSKYTTTDHGAAVELMKRHYGK